jgi:predicted O-methyltransferase YrrM
MVENFSWIEDRKTNFREYVRSLDDTNISEILGAIPSGWNLPPKSHNEFVVWLLNRINPQLTVELGVDYGYSAFFLALNNRKNKVIGIDCFETEKHSIRESDDYQFVLDIKEKLKLDNLEIIKGYFDDVAKTWDQKIDLLHIDGLHDYDNCKNDCDTWAPFLQENGVIIFHDTISAPDGVGLFFSQLEVPKVNFENSYGLGVASNDIKLIEEIKENFNVQ